MIRTALYWLFMAFLVYFAVTHIGTVTDWANGLIHLFRHVGDGLSRLH